MTLFTVLCSAVLLCAVVPAWSDTHSLYYIYTALSKSVELPGIYEFTAMGLLDDRQIDYYNSKEKRKIPKQHWMKEKMQEDYWEKGTQSRKSKEQWFNVNVKILMERMRHNDSDVHVLQWRHGCEIDQEGIETKFSKGIDEYSYDGDNFLSFDDKESQWVAPVDAALQTKRKWDNVPILNQYTKGYLEKECVDWLNKFREYGDEELREGSPPNVHVFAKKCTSDKTKVKLTCMASGFYPKDVTLTIRKYRSSLPNNEIESSGIRPNHDGTFQLKKSVYIKEDEKAEYDCFVSHKTLTEPIIVTWDGKCKDCNEGPAMAIGIGIGAALVAVVACVAGFGFYLYKSKRLVSKEKPRKDEENRFLPGQESASNVTKSQEECINFDKAGSVSTDSGKESASNISGSDRSLEQGHNSGEEHSQTGSKISSSTDSGEASAGASKESSVTNSQEEVNNGDSSGKSKAETQSLLPQNNP